MPRLAAVIRDFDGTMTDTRERTLRVTRRIVREVLNHRADHTEQVVRLARRYAGGEAEEPR